MSEEQGKTHSIHPEVGEDVTKYGEFISTYFSWIPLPYQKENAERMAKLTNKNKIDDSKELKRGNNQK